MQRSQLLQDIELFNAHAQQDFFKPQGAFGELGGRQVPVRGLEKTIQKELILAAQSAAEAGETVLFQQKRKRGIRQTDRGQAALTAPQAASVSPPTGENGG